MTTLVKNEGEAPTFDFAAAVAEARRDYPEETKKVTFIDLSSPTARKDLSQWYWQTDPDGCGTMDEAAWEKRLNAALGNMGFVDPHYRSGCSLLGIRSRSAVPFVEGWSQDTEAQYAFDHELGHLIVPGGTFTPNSRCLDTYSGLRRAINYAENAADCFAVLRGLKRGTMSVENAGKLSMSRATRAVTFFSLAHLTSFALDKMLLAFQGADLSPLTAQDVKALAQKYADDHAPNVEQMLVMEKELLRTRLKTLFTFRQQVKLAFKKPVAGGRDEAPQGPLVTKQKWLQNMVDVCAKSDPASFEFHTAAKILAVVLNTGRLPHAQKPLDFKVTGSGSDDLRHDLAARLQKAGATQIKIKQPAGDL